MSAVWAPVVASLGTLVLAPFGTNLVARFKERRDSKGAVAAACREIYVDLLAATGMLLTNFGELRAIAEAGSKWLHGFHQLTRTAPAQPTLMEIMASSTTRWKTSCGSGRGRS